MAALRALKLGHGTASVVGVASTGIVAPRRACLLGKASARVVRAAQRSADRPTPDGRLGRAVDDEPRRLSGQGAMPLVVRLTRLFGVAVGLAMPTAQFSQRALDEPFKRTDVDLRQALDVQARLAHLVLAEPAQQLGLIGALGHQVNGNL